VIFNTLIALLLMELNVFQALGQVLGLYSNIAISWMAAVVADLVINKPLGLSPAGIEFKRSHLYDINPVGVGAMVIASALSIGTFAGLFGNALQPYAPFVALVAAFAISPLIAWATGGRYYLARPAEPAAIRTTTHPTVNRKNARFANIRTRPKTWPIARPIRVRSARCAARSMPAVTTCANPKPTSVRSGMPCCGAFCRSPRYPTLIPDSATICC
jgi:hypothetical protein